jgi:cell division inhibitor SepF
MGAWRKAGVWLGLVEDDEVRDGGYDDEFDDDDFAVPARPRSLVRPQRGPDSGVSPAPRGGSDRLDRDRLDRDRLDRDRLERERLERDRLDRGRRERPRDLRTDEYREVPRGGFGADRGRGDPYGAERGRVDREAPMVRPEPEDTHRTVRELRTERAPESGSRFGDRPGEDDDTGRTAPAPRSGSGSRPATVRPLVRPTAGSTALSVPAEEDLALAPQVQLRERAAASDDRAARRYEITTLHPTSYSEARAIGEQFRDGHPVIMNLTEMDEPDAKRLVDFAAGLAFGLRGSMERVTNRVFLLTPPNIRVSDEEKQRIADTQL